jgi:hypothetical protein
MSGLAIRVICQKLEAGCRLRLGARTEDVKLCVSQM